MRIREFRPDDSPVLGRLFHETIHAINARDYTPAEIAAWSPAVPPDDWVAERARERIVFVAEDASGLLGFAELRPRASHLDCLYTRADAQGRGIATVLLSAVEVQARSFGLAHLRTEASLTARPFFERRGFVLLARQHVMRRGVKIVNFRMEKPLVAAGR